MRLLRRRASDPAGVIEGRHAVHVRPEAGFPEGYEPPSAALITAAPVTEEEAAAEIERMAAGAADRERELVPYREFDHCPKCGAPEIRVTREYHESGRSPLPGRFLEAVRPTPCMRGLFDVAFGEHLCRKCQDCGFGYVEAVASR